jgi:beta-glucosidase-like glycosyl hydrolase/CubicO group peptidase (beta-lactamase class C family)
MNLGALPAARRAWVLLVWACGLPLLSHAQAWADSILRRMTLEEKVGQLFMVATYSNKDEGEYSYIEHLVREYHLGGLIFMQGSPGAQVKLVNRYQAAARIPLLIAQDAEWGPAMRLSQAPSFPKNMTLGAITEDSLLFQMGKVMAGQLRRLGVGMNFAPVADVNNNPLNPVINVRSFGENKYLVARKSILLARGMQSGGVLPCAKHFPGHGDTDTDSHLALPLIPHSTARLDTLELYPFAKLVEAGIPSMMVGHLSVPALDPSPNTASSVSPKIVAGLLRKSMGYEGLIVTDALNMKGVAQYYPPGGTALQAFLAGNDLLLFPDNIPLSFRTLLDALRTGRISEAELDQRVRNVLMAKQKAGIFPYRSLPEQGVLSDLFTAEYAQLQRRLYEEAMTLVCNPGEVLPLGRLESRKIALVQVGGGSDALLNSLRSYASITPFSLRADFSEAEEAQLLARLKGFNTVILAYGGMSAQAARDYGISAQGRGLPERLGPEKEAIVVLLGSPYAAGLFSGEQPLLVAYEAEEAAQQAAAAALFGGIALRGRLPVSASPRFPAGSGVELRAQRLGFGLPEDAGMDGRVLAQIDSLALSYIAKAAMPGCAVLVLRGGRVVHAQGYGQTLFGPKGESIDPFRHRYDLASLTKVCATTLCVMRLWEQGRLDLEAPVADYLPELAGSDKGALPIRRLLQHNAGFPAYIAFQELTFLDPIKRIPHPKYYSYQPSLGYSYPVAQGFFGSDSLQDLIWQTLLSAELRNGERMVYSDLGLILLGRIVERVAGQPLDACAAQWFYEPLGMHQTGFQPALKGAGADCPPTEIDSRWRNSVIQGYVHDPAAAMMGGVAGHAGLFATASDLAKLAQMLKNGGSYGGVQYLRPETIAFFTARQSSSSRRGLGWDKPDPGEASANVSRYASAATFGHTGFTGTCLWVDPEWDLAFIFLSNRTYPSASNRLLMQDSVRAKLMDKAYEAIAAFRQTHPYAPPR